MVVLVQNKIKIEIFSLLQGKNDLSKLDYYMYFISLLNELYKRDKDQLNIDDGIRLSSIKLREIYRDYKIILDTLIKEDIIIKVSNYSTTSNMCNSYRISDRFNECDFIEYTLSRTALIKKINKSKVDRLPETRKFLKCYFDNKLSIDYDLCKKYIDSNYSNPENNLNKRIRLLNAHKWNARDFVFTVNESTDNRFHSLFTRTPKDLRCFIKYNNEELIGYDLKSSQLFFFSAILKSIMTSDYELMKNLGFYDFYNEELEQDIKSLLFNFDEVNEFIDLVVNKDVYTYFIDYLDFKEVNEKYIVEYMSKGKFILEQYKTKRDLAKKAIMIILNTKGIYENKLHKSFENCFPEVMKIIRVIKVYHNLSNILQQVESYVLLDEVAKEISNYNIPLFTLHDCFYTVKSKGDELKCLMYKYIKLYTSFNNDISINI